MQTVVFLKRRSTYIEDLIIFLLQGVKDTLKFRGGRNRWKRDYTSPGHQGVTFQHDFPLTFQKVPQKHTRRKSLARRRAAVTNKCLPHYFESMLPMGGGKQHKERHVLFFPEHLLSNQLKCASD